MSSKFFNNKAGNTLFDKLKGIASEMETFDRFLAVVGFFRSSGYFKLREELGDISEIKILVGINIDGIFRKYNKALLFLPDEEEAKKIYHNDFMEDIVNAQYAPEIEKGILQMYDDLVSGLLQMRIHATKNLHAKFYLCLPHNHSEHSDGWVIMGSSNISDSGLGIEQPPQYELNVAMKDFDDVRYCSDEFWSLWNEAQPLTAEDIDNYKKETYLGCQPTPYELYIKVLIDTFGDQVEDDFSIQLPDGVKDLKYQKDAVIQGYQMLMQHNGLFLADVVGLGKTMIAAMIAKRFVEANGKNTNILVIFPPALEDNWKDTFKKFGIHEKAQFITNGSLSKILDGRDQYKAKEEFDLIIVDEAHGFRNDSAVKYDNLQRICKASCANMGALKSSQKKVMLISATPLNNRPEDLKSQLLLFQNSQGCTIDGIPNLEGFFQPLIKAYKELMDKRDQRDVTSEVDEIYEQIRSKVIDKVTIRRTRGNILNDPDYKADIEAQGIKFPKILPPKDLTYVMDEGTSALFYKTLKWLTDGKSEGNPEGKGLTYARYRAVEFLKTDCRKKYKNAEHTGQSLMGIYRVHMVKRLESSFHAFKKSLHTFLRITTGMIKMYEEGKIIIAPELPVKNLQENMEPDEIIEYAVERGYLAENITFTADDFSPDFINMLHHDRDLLEQLIEDWEKEKDDPKFDKFRENLDHNFFNKEINPSGKLVLFSESVDTLNYLYGKLKEIGHTDVLMVTSKDRDSKKDTIKENFDAESGSGSMRYNILITSDVLAEGVNLHRSNVIVNYDSPWNSTRLMQRIGRVNRIGSVAPEIHNYIFYPSQQGNAQIQLYKNALMKLQGFHSAFGEDAQIYSKEEIVKEFHMFDSDVKDSIDEKMALLREVRELYNNERGYYNKIKDLPMKSRVMRDTGEHSGKSVIFVSSDVKKEFYLATDTDDAKAIDFLEAVNYLKASREELPEKQLSTWHYSHVKRAVEKYKAEYNKAADTASISQNGLSTKSKEAIKFLKRIQQNISDSNLKRQCDELIKYIKGGIYNQLPRELNKLSSKYKGNCAKMKQDEDNLKKEIGRLFKEYQTKIKKQSHDAQDISNPQIIISESFK